MTPHLTVSPSRQIITAKEITEHFSDNANISWVPLKSLIKNTPEQCVDGRSKRGIIGTPGGNMGEFILALDAAEKLTNVWVRPTEIITLFNKYPKRFGAFYMHTDTHALAHLLNELKADKNFAPLRLKTVKDVEKLTRQTPAKYQDPLLEYLIHPENIGCGHLKLMLLYKNEYQVRRSLIRTAIRTFYTSLWHGAHLELVILEADHEESAVVTVLVNEDKITPQTLIPTVASMGKKYQMFLTHPQAEEFMRRTIAQQIARDQLIYGISQANAKQYLETIVSRGQDLTHYTLSHLALGLPHYTVKLKQD